MKTDRFAARTLAAFAIAASLIALPGIASSHAPHDEHQAMDRTDRQAHVRERLQARLQRMEEKLQITPVQANAWAAYRQTIESVVDAGPAKRPAEADAAAITRFRAERAAAFAQKMSQVADATAALRQALEPEQQKALDEMVRRGGHGHGKFHRR